MMRTVLFAYTDGAATGNPGPGGWGVLLRYGGHEKRLSGSEENTTNNRMELMGAIMALEALKRPCDVILITDSQYVQKGITEWISAWRRAGRMDPRHRKAVANLDIWLRLEAATERHNVTWQWVRGHSGHPENEIADKLAVQAKQDLIAELKNR